MRWSRSTARVPSAQHCGLLGWPRCAPMTWPAAVLLTCMRMPCSLASIAGIYAQKFGAPSVIVTSPWFSVLDIALPVIVESATVVACIHVPGHFLASGLGPRYAYLRRLQQCGRLVVLFGLPRGRWAGGAPGYWCSSPPPCVPGCSDRGGRAQMG
jgi:hypothetical protein